MIRGTVICVLLGLSAASYAKDTGFEGKWRLDKSQSTASSPIPDGLEQQIKIKGSEMVIQSRWKEPQNGIAPMVLVGVLTSELRLNSTGTQSPVQVGPFQGQAVTKVDTTTCSTELQSEVNGQAVTTKWTRTLSPDGRMMTMDIEQTSADGKNGTAKLVFKRK